MHPEDEAPPRDPPESPEDERRDTWVAQTKDRLRGLLAERGLSHRDMAGKLGKSFSNISVLFSKGGLAQWWNLYRIAEELKTTPDALLGFSPVPAARGDARNSKRLARVARLQAQSEKYQRLAAAELEAAQKDSKG